MGEFVRRVGIGRIVARRARVLALAVACCLGGAAWASGPACAAMEADTSAASAAAVPGIGALPASFAGRVHTARGMRRWRLDLLPDGVFHARLRGAHDGPESAVSYRVGRWVRTADGRLALDADGDARTELAPLPDATGLEVLRFDGRDIAPVLLHRLRSVALLQPRLPLEGMFTYLADAASIRLCATGTRLPIAMKGDFRALEGAYRDAHPRPAQPLLVRVVGVIAEHPSMEESQPPRATLVVERFLALHPDGSCAATPGDPDAERAEDPPRTSR